jgi:ceramide glucosyltransferase
MLFVCATAGLLTSTGFLVLTVVAAVRRSRFHHQGCKHMNCPPVTLLKPLCGLEANLEINLTSFFEQFYDAPFEIIFGTRDKTDPAIQVVRKVSEKFPDVPIKFVYSGEPDRPNAKICSLRQMCREAAYDYLVISDSDVRVTPDYLGRVVAPLLRPEVGLVTCVYRGAPTGGFWSRLEGLGMSVEMTSGVIVSDMLEGMTFALGPTMATRKDVLRAIGGVDVLADYYADDYVLGNEVYKSGRTVMLSDCMIDHTVYDCSFTASLAHQVRWMRSARFSRPLGHLSTVLTFAMPFGVLGFLAAAIVGKPWLGLGMLLWAATSRVILCLVAGWGIVRDKRALTLCMLYPLRDFMGFCFWCASYFSNNMVWRKGERFCFQPGGRIVAVQESVDVATAHYGRLV